MSKPEITHVKSDEIDLFEVIYFLLKRWKTLFLISLLGGLLAYSYLSAKKGAITYSYTFGVPDLKTVTIENLILEQIDISRLNHKNSYTSERKILREFFEYVTTFKPRGMNTTPPPKRGDYVVILNSENKELLESHLESSLNAYRTFKKEFYRDLIDKRLEVLRSVEAQISSNTAVFLGLTVTDRVKILESIKLNFSDFTPFTKLKEGNSRETLKGSKLIITAIVTGVFFSLASFLLIMYNSFKAWKANKLVELA